MEIPEVKLLSQSHAIAASSYQGYNQELSSWDAEKGPCGEESNEEGYTGKTKSRETKLQPWAPSTAPRFFVSYKDGYNAPGDERWV